MRRHRLTVKSDANQAVITRALRQVGVQVLELWRGGMSPDLLCWYRGRVVLLECKVEGGTLEESQKAMIADGWPIVVVKSDMEALAAVGAVAYETAVKR